jgi:nitrate/nitrite-specific signal transduction histidine kinase
MNLYLMMMKQIVALVSLLLLVQAEGDASAVNPVCSLCH